VTFPAGVYHLLNPRVYDRWCATSSRLHGPSIGGSAEAARFTGPSSWVRLRTDTR